MFDHIDFDSVYVRDFKIGDKVKIKVERYDWDYHNLTETFKNFLTDAKDKTFTLSGYTTHAVSWELEEDPRWTIWEGYLEKVNED